LSNAITCALDQSFNAVTKIELRTFRECVFMCANWVK